MRPALVHPELTLSLSPTRLRAIFAKLGAPSALGKASAPWKIARALFTGELAHATKDAFATIARFSHDAGRDAILEAADVVGYAVHPLAVKEGPADLAASLVLDRDEAASLAVLRRATIRIDRLHVPVPSYDLAGVPRAFAARFDLEAKLRLELGEDLRDAWSVVDDDGCLHAVIFYDAPPSLALAWEDGAVVRKAARSLRADIVRVDPNVGRFSLTTARPRHLVSLARAFGAALYADTGFFGLGPSMSFKKLLELGRAGFAELALPDGLESWDIVGCQWMKGDGSRHETRGPDALGALERNAHVAGGYFSRITMRITPRGSQTPVDVFMQLPHMLTVSDPRHEANAREAVFAIDGFRTGALADDAHTLAPWVHPEWRWREVVGDAAFEALLTKKLLVRVKTSAVASKDARTLARAVRVTQIPGERGTSYATPEDWSLPARDVRDDETEMWELTSDRVNDVMRAGLGLTPIAKPQAIDGVVDLGHLDAKSGRVRIVYAMQKPPKRLARDVRDACKLGTQPLYLVPEGRRLTEASVHQVELTLLEQFGLGDMKDVLRRIVQEVGLEEEIAIEARTEMRAELTYERSVDRLWLSGVALDALPDLARRMLVFLIESAPKVVSVRELGHAMSSATMNPDVMVRKTRRGLRRWIEQCFVAVGKALPKDAVERVIVKEGRGGYRLGVTFAIT
jgi:hypothetical protein